MTLKRFSLLLLLSLLMSVACLVMAIYYFFYLPGINAEVADQQQQEYVLLKAAFSTSAKNLTTLNYDYAVWDSLVDFVVQPSDEFIENNLLPNAFEAANVDAVFIHKADQQLVWQYLDSSIIETASALSEFVGKKTTTNADTLLPSLAEISAQIPSTRHGYYVIAAQLFYITNTTILPSEGTGEIVGSITMARLVDSKMIDEITSNSMVTFSIDNINNASTYPLPIHDFFSQNQLKEVNASHSWLIHNKFDEQAVVITVHHRKTSRPQLDAVSVMLLLFIITIIVTFSMMILSRFLISPLIHFNNNINNSSNDNLMAKIPSQHFIDEIDNVSNSFNQLLIRFAEQQNYLETLTVQDALTQITNRRGLEAFADSVITTWHQQESGFSVMMIDIDQFKLYNDRHDHLLGDKALVDVAGCLMETMACYDALVARYGGEEFCVIVKDDHMQSINDVAERLRMAVENLHIKHDVDGTLWLTISIGGVVVPKLFEHAERYLFHDVLKQADKQLYIAKKTGRNKVVLSLFQ
ncbi:sensor domain-containing diguanylate cyclase [Shewanella subflava]|uniref:diguanylate cyclase n=1 Tax=Shewanella subflava TaxID=2986476 RepID=A0ABT3I816_9GAMM|nr:diguanylate cyclase [Shewanella subflava]MCW3172215.1 diguanylate cyclase [Shewanella subflava]